MPTDDEIETLFRQHKSNSENNKTLFQQGKYEVIECVGKGGMGKVYRALDNRLKREVAIKEFSPESPSNFNSGINPEISQELRSAFVREATILANLRHTCLPTVFDFFAEDRSNYLVMEYVEGDDLQKRVKELREKFDGQFPVNKVRQWAEDLLEVLAYLHDRESPIFHRDIKPANLKLRNDKICLLDFGLAKGSARNASASVTEKTLHGFTKGFAPLEQEYGEKTTPQTDLYGLTATLYYLLTGEIPVFGRSRHVKNLRPEIDDAFAEIIMQGLAVDPEHRPRSARAMLNVLRREKADETKVKDRSTVNTSFDPSLTQPAPPINKTYPMPEPTPNPSYVPYNQTPLIDSNPKSSKRRIIIFAFVGAAVFCIAGVLMIVLLSSIGNSNDNSNQSRSDSSSKEKRLLAEQKLYENPRLSSSVTATLPKGAVIQDDFSREDSAGIWYKVKSGSREGWILCKKSEKCFTSE